MTTPVPETDDIRGTIETELFEKRSLQVGGPYCPLNLWIALSVSEYRCLVLQWYHSVDQPLWIKSSCNPWDEEPCRKEAKRRLLSSLGVSIPSIMTFRSWAVGELCKQTTLTKIVWLYDHQDQRPFLNPSILCICSMSFPDFSPGKSQCNAAFSFASHFTHAISVIAELPAWRSSILIPTTFNLPASLLAPPHAVEVVDLIYQRWRW